MKKLNTSVALAALAAIFLAAPAVAADLTAPIPEAPNWTAFHVGIGGGGMFAFVDESTDANVNINGNFFINASRSEDLGSADWFGTVEAGFDWQVDSFVIGVLANYDFGTASMKDETNVFVNNNGTLENASFEDKWKVGDTWGVGARAGFLAMDNALIYVMGGYTEAKVKSEVNLQDNNNNNINFHRSDSSWQDGWFVGGGIEALLWENISLKAEYRYADYGSFDTDKSFTDFCDCANSNAHIGHDGDVTVHTIRAVLSYRFNWW